MSLAKFIRILKNSTLTILVLILLFIATALTYFLATTKDSDSFIPYNARLIMRTKSINQILKQQKKLHNNYFKNSLNRFNRVLSILRIIKKQKGILFKRLLHFYNEPAQIILTHNWQTLLTIDVGWKALFFSGGLFAIRSIYSTSKKFSLNYSEQRRGGVDFNLYSLQHNPTRKKIFFSLFSNIILIANNEQTIIKAIELRKAKKTVYHDLCYKQAKTIAQNFKTGLLVHNNLLTYTLPILNRTVRKRLIHSGLVRWLATPLHYKDQKKAFHGVFITNPDINSSLYTLKRFLDSNQFKPRSPEIIPTNYNEATICLFDELTEFQNIATSILGKKKYPKKNINKNLYRWSGNELAFFYSTGQPFLAIHSLEAEKAFNELTKNSIRTTPKRKKSSNQIIKIKQHPFIKNNAQLFTKKHTFQYITRVNNFLLCGSSRDALKKIRQTIKKRDTLRSASKVCNILFLWNKKPQSTFIKKVQAMFRTTKHNRFEVHFKSDKIYLSID